MNVRSRKGSSDTHANLTCLIATHYYLHIGLIVSVHSNTCFISATEIRFLKAFSPKSRKVAEARSVKYFRSLRNRWHVGKLTAHAR